MGMRTSRRLLAVGLGAGLAMAGGTTWRALRAADHADGPATTAEPAADIDDVYAWMSPDTTDLNLVMTIGRNVPPTFRLSDRVQYVFHTTSRPSFGAQPGAEYNVVCEAQADGRIRCWAGTDAFVEGDAGIATGLESGDARLKVFAGVRNDPFYFNLAGFNTVARTVGTVGGSLSFDAAGCPRLDAATASTLVTTLRTGRDDFLGFEAFALVVSIDKALVTRNGSIVSVWGSTHRKS
jgi:hypothetical protein